MDKKEISSDEEHFEDANEKIVNELIEKTGVKIPNRNRIKIDESENEKQDPQEEKDVFEDCEEDEAKKIHPNDSEDYIDDEEQKELERDLTEEEISENKEKAVELKKEGNDLFKNLEYEKSIEIYTSALRICPVICAEERAILYGNRAAAKSKLNLKPAAIDDCTKAIEFNPKYVKVLLRRAVLYEETDKLDECLEDFKMILELDPSNTDANTALIRLPPKINERNEKLKEEMLGKLKDLGNLILRPFGLSTSNFQMQQDPSTGSYSVNFKQNPQSD